MNLWFLEQERQLASEFLCSLNLNGFLLLFNFINKMHEFMVFGTRKAVGLRVFVPLKFEWFFAPV
jgi:hypothetical protein